MKTNDWNIGLSRAKVEVANIGYNSKHSMLIRSKNLNNMYQTMQANVSNIKYKNSEFAVVMYIRSAISGYDAWRDAWFIHTGYNLQVKVSSLIWVTCIGRWVKIMFVVYYDSDNKIAHGEVYRYVNGEWRLVKKNNKKANKPKNGSFKFRVKVFTLMGRNYNNEKVWLDNIEFYFRKS